MTQRTSLAGAFALTLAAGCTAQPSGEVGDDPAPDPGCVSTEDFFRDEVWAPIMSSDCIQCHNPQGAAKDTEFVLQSAAQTGFLAANYETVRKVARFEVEGQSILLLKPQGELEHGGGPRLDAGSAEFAALASLVDQMKDPIACAETEGDDIFADVQPMSEAQLLRKISLNLVGRLPTSEERARAEQDGLPGVQAALDQMMTEEAFYVRLKEIYNDLLLTDRYYGGENAVNLLDGEDYPNRRWYRDVEDDDLERELRDRTNRAVARAPLELIAHVVRNDRPFSEVVTADYAMLDPFSARTYGVSGFAYEDGADPSSYGGFREARIPGVPHAGVLTSHIFLNRFPTTATNVNRHRSRMTYKFFLATDVLKLAERPVDPTQIQDFNPTLYNAACTVCHAVIDPLAGAFQNWDDRGRYRPPEMGWNQEMRPPGFGDETIQGGDNANSLAWLGARIAADERFATSVVHTAFTALTGQEPLSASTEGLTPAQAKAKLLAFDAQEDVFRIAREAFVDANQNFKAAVKALAVSPYVRAANARDLSADREAALAWVGTGRYLTPEMLDRKIEAVTGYPWTRNNTRVLLSDNEFRIFYGGMNSDTVTTRITAPNGVMANIGARMATEMSCLAVPRDFTVEDPASRRLFPFVERGYVPEDANGFEIPGAVEAIKDNIRHLHRHLLGEEADEVEVEATYTLFLETWREGVAKIAADERSTDVDYRCRAERDPETGEDLPEDLRVRRDADYTVRAWMAVTTYLLSDYRFLFE